MERTFELSALSPLSRIPGYTRWRPKDGDKYVGRLENIQSFWGLLAGRAPANAAPEEIQRYRQYNVDAVAAGARARRKEIDGKMELMKKEYGGEFALPQDGDMEGNYKAARKQLDDHRLGLENKKRLEAGQPPIDKLPSASYDWLRPDYPDEPPFKAAP